MVCRFYFSSVSTFSHMTWLSCCCFFCLILLFQCLDFQSLTNCARNIVGVVAFLFACMDSFLNFSFFPFIMSDNLNIFIAKHSIYRVDLLLFAFFIFLTLFFFLLSTSNFEMVSFFLLWCCKCGLTSIIFSIAGN